jgi:hypothetical protein
VGASGLAAALVGDASLATQEAKQLWREDGLLMFVKYVKRHEDTNGDDDIDTSHSCVSCACAYGVGQVASPDDRDDGPLYFLLKFVSTSV